MFADRLAQKRLHSLNNISSNVNLYLARTLLILIVWTYLNSTQMKLTLLAFLFAALGLQAQVKVENLSCEYKINPIGIDEPAPRLSWHLQADARGVMQTAYQIRTASNPTDLLKGKSLSWDSGKIISDQSILVPYTGPALGAGKRVYWQVKVWTQSHGESPWSTPAYWEMGLLQTGDWKASFITSTLPEDTSKSMPSPMLRKKFTLKGTIRRARLYISSLGLYEAHLNGKRVGDELFTPGWTSYNNRLQYQTYDVSNLLTSGENAAGVMLGDGWYRGFLAWNNNRNSYGKQLGLIFQLEVEYTNGKIERILSDDTWKASTGPVLRSDIYNGELYDARLEKAAWTTAGYNDSEWKPVKILSPVTSKLLAPAGPPVRRIEEIKPLKILTTPKGLTVFDMGQNMVGWVRLKVKGPAGTVVKIRHAEVLDKEGNFYTDNLRAAEQLNTYILKGAGDEIYEPHFTFQGFRYVSIEGFPGTPGTDAVTGIVIHSDMKPTGSFSCSHPLLNQLQHNIQWGQKGNFLDVPTDCPQRDERLGWTGDAQAFAPTAAYNMHVAGFFTKWLGDVALDQNPDGRVPFVVPNVLGPNSAGSTGWADAATIIPWVIYQVYGDKRILERQYASMKNWVEFMRSAAGEDEVWDTGFHFGDWLFYRPGDDNDGRSAVTYKPLIQQAFFAYSTDILAKTARILDNKVDAAIYDKLHQDVVAAFQKEYVTPGGRLVSGTQTAYVLALAFDLLPESQRSTVVRQLVENIKSYDNHLTTGFLGTPFLCHVLSRFGEWDMAYTLLLQESYPSWLYPVTQGATTIWERWDGQKPDGTFQNVGMNSFNHYAYGAIGDWMYRNIGGIQYDPARPGYKHCLIAPHPGGNLSSAKASFESQYGTITSDWKISEGSLTLTLDIPANTYATITLPGARESEIKESGKTLVNGMGINQIQQLQNNAVQISTGSGKYTFVYPYRK